MIDFTSRQLRAFLLVAQHRSFTRAAGALFITPSGLSLLIKELENQLSVRLFERTTRQVTLTSSGTELLVAVQRNLDELDRFSRAGRANKGCSRPISVSGCAAILGSRWGSAGDQGIPSPQARASASGIRW